MGEVEGHGFPNLELTHISWVLTLILNLNMKSWQIQFPDSKQAAQGAHQGAWEALCLSQDSPLEDSSVKSARTTLDPVSLQSMWLLE